MSEAKSFVVYDDIVEILDALMYNEKEEHHKNMEQLVDV